MFFLLKHITRRGDIIIPMSDHNRDTHNCIDDKKMIKRDWLKRVFSIEKVSFIC